MKYKTYVFFYILGSLFSLISCSSFHPQYQSGTIKDLTTYPQDVTIYSMAAPVGPLVPQEKMSEEYAQFQKNFFRPWTVPTVSMSMTDAYAIFSSPNTKDKITWWAENLLPWTEKNWRKVEENAARSTYPSRTDTGIVVERTFVRGAPTYSPFFLNPALAGEGFPFDYLSRFNIHLGTPVLITHMSTDGAWVFIETTLASGWVPERTVAKVNAEFIKNVMSLPQAVFIHDNISLKNNSGRYVGVGFLGTILPHIGNIHKNSFTLLSPRRDTHGKVHLIKVNVSSHDVVRMPQTLTAALMAKIANPLLDDIYGWGGIFEHRDCSELMKDLFIPFGVWLPRISKLQTYAWQSIEIEHLSEDEVKHILLEQAIPFATLIGFKGHIGLYLGMYNNTPVMLHDIWGVRTCRNNQEGRHILGRIVITSLKPGAELPDLDTILFDKRVGISILK